MAHIVTLISNPSDPALSDSLITQARAALEDGGTATGEPQWLAPDVACDIPCQVPQADLAPTMTALRTALATAPLDMAIQHARTRRKRLLVADMDSTMIAVECIDEIADLIGIRAEVSAITERAMNGDLDFEAALNERVSLLKGLDTERLEGVYADRVRFTPGAQVLVATMRAHGAFTALVSGGFSFFTERVGEALGFHWTQANELDVDANGKLTGKVVPPVLGRQAKAYALQAIATQRDILVPETMAVGDGANDLAMLGAAGTGVAYHAKPAVAAEAHVRIDHGDLTALLYLQGFKQAEFAGRGA